MFWIFGHEACGILAPRPGIEPTPPVLEGKVLTTGPPGKALKVVYFRYRHPYVHSSTIYNSQDMETT